MTNFDFGWEVYMMGLFYPISFRREGRPRVKIKEIIHDNGYIQVLKKRRKSPLYNLTSNYTKVESVGVHAGAITAMNSRSTSLSLIIW